MAPQVIFVLRISSGSFETGFAATLEILQPGRVNPHQKYTLPARAEVPAAYATWQQAYSELSSGELSSSELSSPSHRQASAPSRAKGDTNGEQAVLNPIRQIQPVPGQTTQRSYAQRQSACKKATIDFEDSCLDWFAQPTFEALRRSILAAVQTHQLQQASILLDANTDDPAQNVLLRKLPWHVWALFEQDLRRSEMILNAPVSPTNHQLTGPVKILAVFGNQAGGLELESDLASLEKHLGDKGAQLKVLNQPSARELQEALRKRQWDMLFFAGHSKSCEDTSGGIIHLQDNVVLTLRDLKASLNKAVENGLKLAVFNSCDGLSLASYLAARKVPISIVMREPVPDRVARYFLEYFLEEFSQGQLTLAGAVRSARERLQWLESDGSAACPAATWLPIVCQNANQSPLRWPDMSGMTLAPPSEPLPARATAPAIAPSSSPAIAQPTVLQPPPSAKTVNQLANATKPQNTSPAVAHNAQLPPMTRSTSVMSPVASPAPKVGKPWRKAALLLLALMVIGGTVSKVLSRNRYTLAPIQTSQNAPSALPTVYKTLEDRFSMGDRTIITEEANYILCPDDKKSDFNQAKRSGTRAMRSQQYEAAAQFFEEAWQLCPAPEVMIYKNNALIANKPSHTLAVVVPINWPNPKNAIEMLRGAAQSQTLINQGGGVNGKPIRLMVIDDGDKPDVAEDIAATLIDDYPGVLAVIGHWTSGVTTAAASVYDARRQLVFMTPVSTTRDLNGDTGWVFRSTINMRDAQKILAKYAFVEAGYRKVATFSLDSAKVGKARALFSEGLQDEFAKSFVDEGGQVVNNFDLGSLDFQENMGLTAKTMIRQAKRQGAEAVMLIPDNSLVPNAEALIKEADKQNLGLLGVTNLYREESLTNTCPAMEGLTMTIAWTADGPSNPEFVRTSESSDFWRGEVNFATAMTYNATQAIAAAMEKSPTRQGIYDALNREDFAVANTADAEPMRFEDGSRTTPADLVSVVTTELEDGNVKCEFKPLPTLTDPS